MDESDIRSLVKGWHNRSRGEPEIVKFVFLWISLNAWLAFESEEDYDVGMLRWLKGPESSSSQLRRAYDQAVGSDVFRSYLEALAKLSPVVSTGRVAREIRVKSADDFSGVVHAIYQVRCNLFHGGKRANDVRDDKLIRTCARILEKWVGNLVGMWRNTRAQGS